ncbi:hypothetical protein BDP27DRAFT_1315844 [Rhodocollybia butyracea]|uniref:Uncharacterized protein n=1 Tax=Rhodocollybia butyracea TaxID=206335 RepID=A0A9P5Q712_9AGAR|nr:hypothetical protein BDP27DRAFT_1315844 [Rhodocollybia butyracea]
MLKRSKMAPLTIEVSPNYWITPRVVEAVSEGLKHLPRINEIHLGITNPAPFLKTLFLDIGRSDYYYHTRGEPYILPENFLGGEAPHLTHIDLTRCHLRWDSTLLCNLTFLKVHNSGPPAPTLDQFLSALAGMRCWRSWIWRIPFRQTQTREETKRKSSLPRLRKLHTTCSLSESAIFFEHVHVPSSASLHVVAKCSDLLEIGSDTLELINQVCQKLPVVRDTTARLSNGVPTIKTLLVQSHGIGSGIIVEAWNNIPSSNRSTQFLREPATLPYTLNSLAYAPSSVGWLRLEFTWQNHDVIRQLHNQVVVAICNPLPLTQLRNLHVRNGYHDNVSSPAFAKTFGTLPKVNSLTVEGNSAYEFVDALNQQTGLERASPAPSSSSSTSLGRLWRSRSPQTLLHPLMDCLMQRYELKSEIYKLILERCTHLTGDDVVELEEIVTDVEWDGLEDGYTDTEDEEMDEDEYDDDMDVFGGEAYYGYGGAYSSDEDMMFLGF